MILEVAILDVKQGEEINFERDFKFASQYISSINGYLNHSLRKCVEVDSRYILLVNWEDLKSHEVGFRTSKEYLKWKELLHHYYDPFPVVEHYETVFENNK
ncbi:antibiotic biosynthesis monooxygenase family protein [Tenacibaculum xiamenense]|uniref:antibiotic biosynthesis monooxygenase family protein n=1 Tax=Tenacibaculum xiamenense TaxID=1261553 RepID=UPI0038931692